MTFDTIDDFLPYFQGIRERTRRVAELVPADRLEWRAADGMFSPGDLIRHLAGTERWMWGENVRGLPSRYPGHGRELADGREAVLAYFDRLHAEAMEIFAGVTPEQLRARVPTPAGAEITAWKWLRAMVEHEVHHRGQIYMMLRLLDVPTPPLYGLTEEQVKAASLAPLDG